MVAVSVDRAVGATPVRAVGVGNFSRRPMFLFSFSQINVFIFYDFFAFNFLLHHTFTFESVARSEHLT
jgi:hypothetical protein